MTLSYLALFRRLGLGLGLLLALPLGAVPRPDPAVATAHPQATAAAVQILRQEGNAFDAAVAATAALAVVEPYSSGIGGGGFWLLHRAQDGHEVMLDGREIAPGAAHRDLYLDDEGAVVPGLSIDGPLAAGIPGVPAALEHLARHYGHLPLSQTLAPAIRLAREGFEVDGRYRRLAKFRLKALQASPAAAELFLHQGEVPPLGHLIQQPDLARTLERIAEQGAKGFYEGPLAQRLVDGVRAAGGIWTLEDLASYRVKERAPIRFRHGDYAISSAAPPSSGGVALAQMFAMLEGYDLQALDTAQRVHLLVEIMRRAYRDRAEYLGDPDFVEMPIERLTHPFYAAGLRQSLRLDRKTDSQALAGAVPPAGGRDTTHFSILDREGNRVAATLSINYPFGSGLVPPGTGVLLNDEMDDFSASPGVPNAYGLVGAEANAIAPHKRMLSSMSPSFIVGPRRIAAIGTPGGSRIISVVFLGALAFMEGATAEEIVALPRFHHQYLPDQIQHEEGALDEALRERLSELGHSFKQAPWRYGNMQLVIWNRRLDQVSAASDPRGVGAAEVVK